MKCMNSFQFKPYMSCQFPDLKTERIQDLHRGRVREGGGGANLYLKTTKLQILNIRNLFESFRMKKSLRDKFCLKLKKALFKYCHQITALREHRHFLCEDAGILVIIEYT